MLNWKLWRDVCTDFAKECTHGWKSWEVSSMKEHCMRNLNWCYPQTRLFGCRLCDRKFFRELDVVEHVKRSHPVSMKETLMTEPISYLRANNEYFDPACVCSRCGKKFASKAYVDNHERSCDGMFVRQPKFTQSKVSAIAFANPIFSLRAVYKWYHL